MYIHMGFIGTYGVGVGFRFSSFRYQIWKAELMLVPFVLCASQSRHLLMVHGRKACR